MQSREANSYDTDTYLFWQTQIEAVINSDERKKFIKRGRKINEIYSASNDELDFSASNYNILYSNTETLLPVIYNDKPRPDIRARNKKNIAARKGAEVIEEGISYYLSTTSFNDKGSALAKDYLLAGLGQMRVKYRPLLEQEQEAISDDFVGDFNEDEIVQTEEGKVLRFDKVVYEELEYEYVHWENYLYQLPV